MPYAYEMGDPDGLVQIGSPRSLLLLTGCSTSSIIRGKVHILKRQHVGSTRLCRRQDRSGQTGHEQLQDSLFGARRRNQGFVSHDPGITVI